MPGPAARIVENAWLEILAPMRSCRDAIVCDCCRRAKSPDDFDEDGFGICCDCLDSDALIVKLDPRLDPEPSS